MHKMSCNIRDPATAAASSLHHFTTATPSLSHDRRLCGPAAINGNKMWIDNANRDWTADNLQIAQDLRDKCLAGLGLGMEARSAQSFTAITKTGLEGRVEVARDTNGTQPTGATVRPLEPQQSDDLTRCNSACAECTMETAVTSKERSRKTFVACAHLFFGSAFLPGLCDSCPPGHESQSGIKNVAHTLYLLSVNKVTF